MSDLDATVAVQRVVAAYPEHAPFAPSEPFPEAPFGDVGTEPNPVYAGVRAAFRAMGLDGARFGTREWNPLGGLVRPGETVLLKPNLIRESHPGDPGGWVAVITHGSVIRAVADYVYKALAGTGRVVLADAPQTDSSFAAIVERLGLAELQRFYAAHGLELELRDLRREEWTNRDGVIVERRALPGDPEGNVRFDLGKDSAFAGHAGGGRYYGADYDVGEVNRHHQDGRHEYLIAASAIRADVVFSLPKLKTHKKTGITVSLKNLVGVNGDKNWLPHHTEGSPRDGGDEHPSPDGKHRTERRAVRRLQALSLRWPRAGTWLHRNARRVGTRFFGATDAVIRSGNWWGNDTTWRMALDLNTIVAYGNPDGSLRSPGSEARKRHLVLVDGVIAGEGNGPVSPDAVRAGLLVFGTSPPRVDATCAVLMGFDPERIPIVREAFAQRPRPLVTFGWRQTRVVSNHAPWNGELGSLPAASTLRFRPHFGWTGRLERSAAVDAQGPVAAPSSR